jgi:ectoine hydroxylase-related dioxygenase (phytanoyl-CoA dioxygenase family)
VLTHEQAEQFDRDGYVVMSGVFDADLIADVKAEIDAAEAKTDEFLRSRPDGRFSIAEAGSITFSVHLVTRSALLRAFATHPVVLSLCADLVGPDVNLYWDQGVYKKPERPRRFPWHQDNGYTFIEPQQYLTCWVALTDATIDNGCPWVAPGVHRQGTLAHTYVEPLGFECFSQPEQAEAAPVGSGGIVVFSSLTPHLTGPNTTSDVRKAYILQYAPAGAVILQGDAATGPPVATVLADAPDRQFAVLRDGHPVPAPTE